MVKYLWVGNEVVLKSEVGIVSLQASMKIDIKVIPSSKKNFIKQEGEAYKIYLTAPAVEGKANKVLVEFLADHFAVKKHQINILKGLKSRQKTIIIEGI